MTPPRQNSADAFAAAARRTRPQPSKPAATPPAQRKYTVLIDAELADDFDASLLQFRRRAGRRVDKSEVIRELVSLFNEDPSLADQVADRLYASGQPTPAGDSPAAQKRRDGITA